MTKIEKEKFNLDIDKPGIENKGYDKSDPDSPPKYLWDRKIFSLIWLSYCVSFPKLYSGKETYLSNLATRAVKDTFENKKIKRLIGEWNLVWGVSVEQRPTSNVADATMFVAKYKPYNLPKNKGSSYGSSVRDSYNTDYTEDDKPRYVISIAGTNPFSIFTTLFQDLSIFKTRSWNKGEPWSKDIRDQTSKSDRAAISSGASRGLKIHLTKMQGARGELLLDFLKKEIKTLVDSKKKEIEKLIETEVKKTEERANKERENSNEETRSGFDPGIEIGETIEGIKEIMEFLPDKNRSDVLYILDLDDRKLEKIATIQRRGGVGFDKEVIKGLKKQLKSVKQKIRDVLKVEITVAGHSLGGGLAEIVALALKERQKDWDKYKVCTIKVVSVGNPCFTNDKCVDRYKDNKLDREAYRFWCNMDMIHYFTTNTRKLATIYEPDISGNILIDTLTNILCQSVKQNKYRH
ncbi:MAG: hypothetical protein F6K22_32945, partial [Okeania sp. SIO2F4]|uniref:lipase family protein n=1 Tax=Okeania sp. SIO2F4 TaxID=2607790 RepID=UPI00142967DC